MESQGGAFKTELKVVKRDPEKYKHMVLKLQAEIIKGCKTDSSGTVVQGNHKYYRSVAVMCWY